MKFIKSFLVLLTAILSFSSVNVPGQNYGQKGNIKGPSIEAQVIKQILRLPYYGVFDHISFKVEDGVVTLFGKVVQPTTKSGAGRVVERIKGVSDVINRIEVLPLSNFVVAWKRET